jgi:sugar (pentulose or hexulose) kinase
MAGGHRLVQPKDLVNLRLTGVLATDVTSCMGVMNLLTRRIEPGLRDLIGLPDGLLPPAFEPFAPIGRVSAAAAGETGLPAGIPVVAGWIDAYASKLGTGLGSAGQAFDVAGTAEIVGVAGREPAADLQGLLAIPLYGDLWSVYGLTNTGSDSLRWFVEAFIDRALGGDAFATFEREARAVPAGADGLLFLPYIFGERSPVWDEDMRGLFCGIDRSHGRGHFARAVMEGVGHSVRQLIDRARLVGKAAPDRIRASGGGTRNALVNQIKADITGLPLETLKVNETGALGSAMLAAIGIGLARDYADAVNRMVHADRLYQPDPAKREVYARAHRRYAQLYPAIRGLQEVA